ncbi:hypothetical protein I3V78_04005 [Archangium primigenium]|nr:hypothetical protein [Archangium primigenium]
MSPESACPFRHALQDVRRDSEHGCFQRQFGVNLEQSMAAGSENRRHLHAEECDGMTLVMIADEWKASVSRRPSKPRVALWQGAELMIIGNGPIQAQARNRSLHRMDHIHGTRVIVRQRERADLNTQGVLRK